MPLEDKVLRRRAERTILKFPLDLAAMSTRAVGDTIHLEGRVRLMRGSADAKGTDLNTVLRAIDESLRAIPGVREVVMSNLTRQL